MAATRIVGIDIGHDVIRAVEVENAATTHPIVTRMHAVELPEGAVRGGEVRDVAAVTAAMKQLWTEGDFKSKDVVMGMGNQRVMARDVTVPYGTLEQIRESLPFQVQDLLPMPASEAVLDFYPVSEGTSEAGPVVHGLLIAAEKSAVLNNVNAARKAGLSPVQVDLIPFALARVMSLDQAAAIDADSTEGSVVLVEIGANTTHFVITAAGIPQFVRMIPAGSDDVTRALVERLSIEPQAAEDAKRARGLSNAPVTSEFDRIVAEVIYEKVGELFNSLRNTINYFANTHQGQPISTILLGGGGAAVVGLAGALEEFTRLRVVVPDPLGSVQVASDAVRTGDPTGNMTVALGLALGSVA
jgi:type IV pilus assembly protein PilM